MSEKNPEFEISVVMPIYNVQQYLQESIESVVNQTLGFEDNIQLILVNDGSTDGSEKVCLQYQKKFPDNIQYVYQKNSGVSAARNLGLKFAKGRYINFLDSDDKWTIDALENAIAFLRKHTEIPFVACKMHFFDGKEGYHYLSRGEKFKEDRVIDIEEEYKFLQLHVASVIFDREFIGEECFDIQLKYGEDALFLNTILLQYGKYGVLTKPEYLYRKRTGESSVIQGAMTKKEYYLTTVERFVCGLAKQTMSDGRLRSRYVQNLICYEIRNYAKLEASSYLDEQSYHIYMEYMMYLIKLVDDELLFRTKDMSLHKKIAFVEMKYGCEIKKQLQMYNGNLVWNNQAIFSLETKQYLKITKNNLVGNQRIMELEIPGVFVDLMDIRMVDMFGTKYMIHWENVPKTEVSFFEKVIATTKKAVIELEEDLSENVYFLGKTRDKSVCYIDPEIVNGIAGEKKGFFLKMGGNTDCKDNLL